MWLLGMLWRCRYLQTGGCKSLNDRRYVDMRGYEIVGRVWDAIFMNFIYRMRWTSSN